MDGCVEQTSIRKQSELCIFVTHFSQKRIAALLLLKCLRSEGEGPLFIYLKPSGWKGFCFTLLQRMRAEWQWQPCFPQGRLVAMLINYKRQTDRQTAPQTGRIGHGHTHKGKKRRKKTRGGRKSYTLGLRKIERKRKRSSPRREHSFCTAPASAPATWLWVNTFRHNLSWESETGSLTGINSRGRKKNAPLRLRIPDRAIAAAGSRLRDPNRAPKAFQPPPSCTCYYTSVPQKIIINPSFPTR